MIEEENAMTDNPATESPYKIYWLPVVAIIFSLPFIWHDVYWWFYFGR